MDCHRFINTKSVDRAFYESAEIPRLLLSGDKTRVNWACLESVLLQAAAEVVQKTLKYHGGA